MFNFLKRGKDKAGDPAKDESAALRPAPQPARAKARELSEPPQPPLEDTPLNKSGRVPLDDTFAEAFGMAATGLIITAPSRDWALEAARSATGFATSVIGCGVEAGIDREIPPEDTPDGRPGVRILLFAFNAEGLQAEVASRAGQCILTAPGTACFAGVAPTPYPIKLGGRLRYFGDGFQSSKMIGGRRYWRIPVMDGEFLCEAETWVIPDAVGGGNLILLGRSQDAVLRAAETAAGAMRKVPDVILPFPGGLVRSGSKVGSKYKSLVASTNEAFSPVLRGRVATELEGEVRSVLEIVIDGLSAEAVARAMAAGIAAAREASGGLVRITAGNYGGKLGPHHFHLRKLAA